MRYHILAVDYDGTLAHNGQVPDEAMEALKKLKASSRKLILVTGRELDELIKIFPGHAICDRIVAENGALIYNPATREEMKLGEPPPESFINKLRQLGVNPLSVGRVIVATWEPHQNTVLETIKKSGIERQVIFNKGAVMVLPAGVNKAKGLETVLHQMHLSVHNVVAAGDAENDSAMLHSAECSVAVANALPAIKKEADWVSPGDHAAGIIELINLLLENDLAFQNDKLKRHFLTLGTHPDGSDYSLSAYGPGLLLAGTSGGGKTTLTAAFLEELANKQYQFCLIDPEGDYTSFTGCAVIGNDKHPPVLDEIFTLLENPLQNIVVCLLAIPLADRPGFSNKLLSMLMQLRKNTGHPHWLIFDEAHHLFPAEVESSFFNIPSDLNNFMLITNSLDEVNQVVLEHSNSLVTLGGEPAVIVEKYARRLNLDIPSTSLQSLPMGQAWVWENGSGKLPFPIHCAVPKRVMHRHKKKYAAGDMAKNSFYFKGPHAKLNLRAQNLIIFAQMAEGIDEDTWLYHLKRHDYSNWLRNAIHDEELADLSEQVEKTEKDPESSRKSIIQYILERYTAPEKK